MLQWFKNLFQTEKQCCGGCSHSVDLGITDAQKAALQQVDDKVVVGRILEITPHPDPKVTKVRVTQTTVGSETAQILCGAENIEVGMTVPVAMVGADLGGGFVIGKRAIRGVESSGMICSQVELGLSEDDQGGIWPLPEGLSLGAKLKELAA